MQTKELVGEVNQILISSPLKVHMLDTTRFVSYIKSKVSLTKLKLYEVFSMELLTKQEELFLLAVFGIGQNAYLVNIREHLKKHMGKDWAFGSIYITLEKLRKRGLINARVGRPSARQGGKAIKYYRLSKKGIQVLRDNKHLHDKMWKEFVKHA